MDNKIIQILNALITELGDVTLSEAVTWAQVEENAQKLLAEGHEAPSE
jgi:hypothetical protein